MASVLPPAVQRQLEQAEAQLVQQTQPPVPPQDPPAPPPAPTAPPPAPAPVAPPPAPAQDDWQQKYRSLQGMFQRTVPELQAQNKRYESELAAMRQQMAAMTEAINKVQPPATEPNKPEIDPRDARAFGEDMVEMVQRYATRTFDQLRNQFQASFAGLEKRLQVIEQGLNGVSQRTESSMETQFYATLEQLVPDWKTINASPEWLEWLGEVDPIYGIPRQTALDSAFERRDPARVAAVFRKFQESRPAPRPQESVAPLVTPSEGGGGNPNPPAPPQRVMLSQKDIQKFYDDVTKGRYRNRQEEAQRIEREIDLAAREGRII